MYKNTVFCDLMSKRQDKIKELLETLKEEYGVSQAKIAKRIGLSPQQMNYHLNSSPELDLDIYNKILGQINRFDISKITIEQDLGMNKFDGAISVRDYPVLSEVYAGEPDKFDVEYSGVSEPFTYYKKNHSCFALKVNGKSMETTLNDGDLVLVDMDLNPVDGDLVAVKLRNGNQYIKRYKNMNYAFVQLSSDNSEYGVRLIDKNDIEAIYPVVQIVLNIRNGERK